MDEPAEELEPLFDYGRVQPFSVVTFDDDDSLDIPLTRCQKKQKTRDAKVVKETKNVEVINIDEDEDDEDWLQPPPKVTTDPTMFTENSTIKELRLVKQQLVEIAESAGFLQAVEESVRQELAAADSSERAVNASSEAAEEVGTKQPSVPSCERAKIVISVQDRNDTKQFRVFMDDKFEKFFKMYGEKLKLDLQNLVFCFDGDIISPATTPRQLGMEDNDIIEVHIRKN